MQQIRSPQQLLYEILHVLFKWKILVVLAFITTFVGIVGGTYLVTPQWQATTKLLAQQNPRLQPVIFHDLVQPGMPNPKMSSSELVLEIALGREMAQEVVEAFRLDERLYQKKNSPTETRDKIKYCMRRIVVDFPKAVLIKIGILEEEEKDYIALAIEDFMNDWANFQASDESDVVMVGIWGESPELATEISRFVAERATARTLDLTNSSVADAYDFAKSQMPVVSEKLHAAEEQLRTFKQENSITALDDEIRIKMERLDGIESELTDVEVEKRENSERIRELKSHLDEQEGRIVEAGFIAGNSLIVNLKTSIADLEAEKASLLAEKKESHPDVVSLSNRIADLKENLRQEIQNIVGSETETMSPIYQDLVERLINAEIDEFLNSVRWLTLSGIKKNLENDLLALSDKKTEIARLSRRVEVLEELYKDFETQLEELHILNKMAINEIAMRVIDPGYVPPTADPDWPRMDIAIAMGLICAVLFALIVPFAFEYWSDAIRAAEVEELLGKPVSGEVFRA